ncbi:hypothetical protein BCP6_008 [Bacillus phage BCP6]|nr:hypothetical protein BCP6_008 [Bacillus phage BCP6]
MTNELNYNDYGDVLVNDNMIIDNDLLGVKFIRKYENKDDNWKGYEFETNEFLMFEGYDNGGSLFRLEIQKDYTAVMVAYSEDYTVMEDVSHNFDIVDLLQRVLLTPEIHDEQEAYDEWWEEYKEEEE